MNLGHNSNSKESLVHALYTANLQPIKDEDSSNCQQWHVQSDSDRSIFKSENERIKSMQNATRVEIEKLAEENKLLQAVDD